MKLLNPKTEIESCRAQGARPSGRFTGHFASGSNMSQTRPTVKRRERSAPAIRLRWRILFASVFGLKTLTTVGAFCLITSLVFSADPVTPPPKPAPWNPTNALNNLPAADRLWLLGEQLKQLIGDWANQQGDIGMDLMFYLEEPVKILTQEVKRIEREQRTEVARLQKDIAELRAEIQALKQAQEIARTNPAAAAISQGPAAPTNKSEPRPSPRSSGKQ
jgi:hypothetical protein